MNRFSAATVAENFENRRDGAASTVILGPETVKGFWEVVKGEEKDISKKLEKAVEKELTATKGDLYQISDQSGVLKTKLLKSGKLSLDMLKSSEAFVIDFGSCIYVWIGKDASGKEKRHAVPVAIARLNKNKYPKDTPLRVLKEGGSGASHDDFKALLGQTK